MKYKAIFLRKENDRLIKICEKKFKLDDTTIEYGKGKTFTLGDLSISYSDGNTSYIFVNTDGDGSLLSFNELKQILSSDDLDLILTKKVIAQLALKIKESSEPFSKSHILGYVVLLIAGICIGITIGILVAPSIMPHAFVTSIPTQTPLPTPPPTLPPFPTPPI